MEISLKFVLENKIFPLDYRKTFISFFKESLSVFGTGKWGKKLYVDNNRKPFTFAINLPNPKFSKECITLEKPEIELTFSTSDNYLGYIFMCAFEVKVNKPFPIAFGNKLILKRVLVSRSKHITGEKAIVKMWSPLCLREHNKERNEDIYYSVASENFGIKSKEIIKEQLISDGFPENLASNIEITPIHCKKTVVLHYGTYIECSLGVFEINADNTTLNHLLQNGIGSRKSAGFGFPKLIY